MEYSFHETTMSKQDGKFITVPRKYQHVLSFPNDVSYQPFKIGYPDMYKWLVDNVGTHNSTWHILGRDYHVRIGFVHKNDATQFKLTWC